MKRRQFIAASAALPALSGAATFTGLGVQSEFFDVQYYANHNPDLIVAGLRSYAQLRAHWVEFGKREGRKAHPAFHAPSYAANNPDLSAAFGRDYVALYWHYVTSGQHEQRIAYDKTAAVARLGDVSIGATPRCGGAVDTFVFGDRECVNSYDHGRQLQTACYDLTYDGCYNPTQAGSARDGEGRTTSSVALALGARDNVLRTRTRTAFWAAPGSVLDVPPLRQCTPPYSMPVSEFIADTWYMLRARNDVTVIDYKVAWDIGADVAAGKFMAELTTGYHPASFSEAYEIVPELGYAARPRHIAKHSPGVWAYPEERPYPMLLATPDGARAVGVVARPVVGAVTAYGAWGWDFRAGQETHDCTKWSAIRRYTGAMQRGKTAAASCYIVAGGATAVHQEIARIMRAVC